MSNDVIGLSISSCYNQSFVAALNIISLQLSPDYHGHSFAIWLLISVPAKDEC